MNEALLPQRDDGSDVDIDPTDEEGRAIEIAALTPSHERLMELVDKSPAPPEWFENHEEKPF